jgi:ferredoxin
MRVSVDPNVCQGHGVCRMSAPELFHLREEDGQAYVDSEVVPAGMEAAARLGASSCPERAITVWDE